MRRLIIGLCVAVASVAPVGIGQATAATSPAAKINRSATLNIASPANVGVTLDPHKEVASSDIYSTTMIYDRLFYIDKNQELQPQLATKWSFAADGKQLTVTLRDDAVFHDGTRVDATAVKQSLDRSKTQGGAVSKALLEAITTVEVINPLTVRINMSRPAADIPYALGRNAGAVVNPKAIAAGTDLTSGDVNMAGSGAYVVGPEGFKPLIKVQLVRATTPYWDKKAGGLASITMNTIPDPNTTVNALGSGQLNAAAIPSTHFDAAKSIQGNKLVVLPTASFVSFMMRETRPPFNNLLVRQAVATAIDRDAIGNGLLNGTCTPSYQNFVPSSFAYSSSLKDPFAYNVATAKKMLTKAGFPNGIEFTAVLPPNEPALSIGQAVQAQLAKAGITMKIDLGTGPGSLADFVAGKYDAHVQNNVGQSYPTLFLSRYIQSNGQLYKLAGGAPGDQLNALVNEVLDPTLKGSALQAKWEQINKLLIDNAWSIPICNTLAGFSFPKDTKNVENMSWAWGQIYDLRYVYRTAAS